MLRSAEGASGGPGLLAGGCRRRCPPSHRAVPGPTRVSWCSCGPTGASATIQEKKLKVFFFFSYRHAHDWSRLFSAPQVLALQIQLKQGRIQGLGTGMSSPRASLATGLALLVALLSAAGAEGHSSRHHVQIPPAASPGPAGSC